MKWFLWWVLNRAFARSKPWHFAIFVWSAVLIWLGFSAVGHPKGGSLWWYFFGWWVFIGVSYVYCFHTPPSPKKIRDKINKHYGWEQSD